MTVFFDWYTTLPLFGQIALWVLGILLFLALVKRLLKLAILVTILIILMVALSKVLSI